MSCQIQRDNIPNVHLGKVFYIQKTSLEAQDPLSWLALCGFNIDTSVYSVSNAYKLAHANWNNSQLDFQLMTEKDTSESNSVRVGDCLPTLESLNAAKYLYVPSDWSSSKLSELSEADTVEPGSYRRELQQLDSGRRLSTGNTPELSRGVSEDVFRSPTVKDEETSPLIWVAGLGAAGLLAYFLLKKG